jgi:hypothetical protein
MPRFSSITGLADPGPFFVENAITRKKGGTGLGACHIEAHH